MKKLKILICDFGMPFDFHTLHNSPLGGSEASSLLLAKGLSMLGHSVVLLNTANWNCPDEPSLRMGHLANMIPVAEQSDIIILNRQVPQELYQFLGKKNIYYWSHDAYDQDIVKWMMNKQAWEGENVLSGIFCVSEWQKKTFVDYLNVKEDMIRVLPNPIYSNFYQGYTKRDLNKLVFCSIPYKGIDVIGDLFNAICVKSKRNDLQLHVFSSMNLYGNNQGDEQYQQAFHKLANTKNVVLRGAVSMKELAYELATSNLMLHPCTYHETFGRVFIESLAAGCIPVTVNNGANFEVLEFNGSECPFAYVTMGKNIKNVDTFNSLVDVTCMALDNPKEVESLRKDSFKFAMKYDYINVARMLLAHLGVSS